MPDTRMQIDGQDTGVKLKLDLDFVYRTVVLACLIGGGSLLISTVFSVKDGVTALASRQDLMKYQIEQMDKKLASYAPASDLAAVAKQAGDCLPRIEADARLETTKRDYSDLDRRVTSLEASKPK